MKQETPLRMPQVNVHHHHTPKEPVPHHKIALPTELLLCDSCGAVWYERKWQWMKAPTQISLGRCPSCTRVSQKTPAGYVVLQGHFALDHRNEILSLIHHIETREKTLDPLKRIMWIEYQQEEVIVTTADMQLTRTIGEALQRAYKGELDYHFNEAEMLLFLSWKR